MRIENRPDELTSTLPVFRLLILYRWLSLVPAVLALVTQFTDDSTGSVAALLAAALVNLFITLTPTPLNAAVRQQPGLLTLDVLFCAALIGGTGGWDTPYYLYSLCPLLAAAFFFELRGALLGAVGMAGLFVVIGLGRTESNQTWLQLATQVVGYFLMAGAFGYATTLFARIQTSHAELNRTYRDLEVIHGLTLSLQHASDVNEVQERVLTAVTSDLGFPRATIALVDQNERVITSWLSKVRDGHLTSTESPPHPARLPLTPDEGLIAQCLLDRQARLSVGQLRTSDDQLNAHLASGPYHVFPMLLREHPVGVLLVDASERDNPARLRSLQAIASQAAVAVGTTMLCIDRAQRLAVQDERVRIAREIHDTVSQSLFGLTYSLEACIRQLPHQPEVVRAELQDLLKLAEATRGEVRQSILNIWPSELTASQFASDLRRYMEETCRASPIEFSFEIRGDFGGVPARARRSLYRIAQEALTNIVRHAAANQAQVCLDVAEAQALLAVRDNGRGFDPHIAMAREFDREHFGLRGIHDRAASLGGTCEVISQPGAGTSVLITVPVGEGR